MYVCIWVYVCMCVCVYVCLSMYVGNRMYVCRYVSMYVCIFACLYVCMFVCTYVSMYVCINVCTIVVESQREHVVVKIIARIWSIRDNDRVILLTTYPQHNTPPFTVPCQQNVTYLRCVSQWQSYEI